MKENVVLVNLVNVLYCAVEPITQNIMVYIYLILLLQLVYTSWRVGYSTIICTYRRQTCLHAQGCPKVKVQSQTWTFDSQPNLRPMEKCPILREWKPLPLPMCPCTLVTPLPSMWWIKQVV